MDGSGVRRFRNLGGGLRFETVSAGLLACGESMSKKLLTLLIAASACCAFGCGDDDSSCQNGERRCDGDELSMCAMGKWITQKCANGCDAVQKVCKGEGGTSTGKECAPGGADKDCKAACKSDGSEGYYWKGDKVETLKCEGAQKCKVDGNQVGCVAEGASECEGGKSECVDAKTSRVCAFGTWVSMPCDGGCDSTTGDCVDKDCTATSKGLCTPACSADKTEGYMWSAATGKNETVKCDGGKTCSVSEGSIVCGSGGSGSDGECTGDIVTTGGEVGNCCDSKTYKSTCTDGNAHALVCVKGKVTQWTCANNGCKPMADSNRVECKKEEVEASSCNAESTAKCDAACSEDGGKGYYWNVKDNTLVTLDCAADGEKCFKDGYRVYCKTPTTGEACDPTKDMPTCGENDTVKYCREKEKEFVVKTDCPQCHVEDDTFFCNGDHLLEDCTKDSKEKCKGACDAKDPLLGWWWNSKTNKVDTKTCNKGYECNASKTGWVSCVKAQ